MIPQIKNHKVGEWKSWKFGLITREVYRVGEKTFCIHDMSDGWRAVTVRLSTMEKLYTGKKSLLDLNWDYRKLVK